MNIRLLVIIIVILFTGAYGCEKSKEKTGAIDPNNDKTVIEDSSTLMIPGTGANQDLVRALAKKFMEINKKFTIEVPDSIGSTGGIKEVTANRVDIARISRALTEDEKSSGLVDEVFGISSIVFGSHPGVKIKNLSSADILKIYSGEIKNWKALGGDDLVITVIGREENDSSRQIIEKQIKEFKNLTNTEITTVTKDQDMLRKLEVKEGSIGFGTLSNMKTEGLNVFNLDNLEPGKVGYKLTGAFAFVYFKDKLSPLAKKFLEFVFSSEGQKIITEQYCIVVSRKK